MDPTENPNPNSENPPAGDSPAAPQNTEAKPPTTPQTTPSGKVVTMPSAAIAEIKRAEREKAARRERAQADKDARELGYASHADMITKLKAKKAGAARTPSTSTTAPAQTPPETPPETPQARRAATRQANDRDKLIEQRRAANRARAASERKVRELQRKYDAQQAENELRITASRHGVEDVDYALVLLQRRLSRMTQEELKAFDEDQFFSVELRKEKPHLYGTTVEPATTSPDTKPGAAPKPPVAPTNGEKPDARKVSKQDYEKMLLERGLTPPRLGMPS